MSDLALNEIAIVGARTASSGWRSALKVIPGYKHFIGTQETRDKLVELGYRYRLDFSMVDANERDVVGEFIKRLWETETRLQPWTDYMEEFYFSSDDDLLLAKMMLDLDC
jgi:hypothetical protein